MPPRQPPTGGNTGSVLTKPSPPSSTPRALAREDGLAEGEARWILLGMSARPRLLTVVYTLRGDERIRLISARKATRKEAEFYA